ncbi:MAG: hypothetical protein KBD47_00685 [Candidatus Pacebacteria bacterium]|nr:hypothetical protein [Candidatus Paceibacterota bacterium]
MYARGFSIIEALLALLIVTTMTVTAFEFDAYTNQVLSKKTILPAIVEPVFSDRYRGYDTCFLNSHYTVSSIEYVTLPFVTSVVGRSGYVFVTADSNMQSDPDLYIFKNGAVEAALPTGPGLRDIAVTKGFVYAANTSSLSQVQKIDISNILSPKVIAAYAFASTGNVILFDQNKIYIGVEKSSGPEFAVLNENLSLQNMYETNSQINDIYVTDKIYVAASDVNQLHILGKGTFSPSGWETQQGKALAASGTEIYFGRTVGGFNNKSNHELFLLGSTSVDIGTGVYGLVSSGDLLFVATKGVQVWKKPFTYMYTIPLNGDSISLSCDKDTLLVGLKSGFATIHFTYAN